MTEEGDRKSAVCSRCQYELDCDFVVDPYTREIHGGGEPDWYCDGCQKQSAADI